MNFTTFLAILACLLFQAFQIEAVKKTDTARYRWLSWSWGDKVRLSDVHVLTLQQGMWTTGRRKPGIPQLQCVGSWGACWFSPRVVQCYNRGSDGVDVQWECKAELDYAYRFGTMEVLCEGYDYPNDPYVLKGSCGLRYSLERNDGTLNYRKAIFVFGVIVLVIVLLLLCIAQRSEPRSYYSNHHLYNPYPGPGYGYGPGWSRGIHTSTRTITGTRTASGFGGTRRR